MPSIPVQLYDDSKTVVLSTITIICSEAEARFLEKLLKRNRFSAHLLAIGAGRNMTFRQFRQHFIDGQDHSDSNDFWETKDE
jgi:hypothetical protein